MIILQNDVLLDYTIINDVSVATDLVGTINTAYTLTASATLTLPLADTVPVSSAISVFQDTGVGTVTLGIPVTSPTYTDMQVAAGRKRTFVTVSTFGREYWVVVNQNNQTLADISSGTLATNEPPISDEYLLPADPTPTTNPTIIGTLALNTNSGEIFTCTDPTINANVWVGQQGSYVSLNQKASFVTNYVDFPPSLSQDQVFTYTFAGSTDDGSIVSYEVSAISSTALTVASAIVPAGNSHVFTVGVLPAEVGVNFTVAAIDDQGLVGTKTIVNLLLTQPISVSTVDPFGDLSGMGLWPLQSDGASLSGIMDFTETSVTYPVNPSPTGLTNAVQSIAASQLIAPPIFGDPLTITLTGWVKWDGIANVIAFGINKAGFAINNNRAGVYYANTANIYGVDAAMFANTWVFVGMVLEHRQTNKTKLWINHGWAESPTLVGSHNTWSPDLTASPVVVFGRDGSGWYRNFGAVAQMRLFSRELTFSELSQLSIERI